MRSARRLPPFLQTAKYHARIELGWKGGAWTTVELVSALASLQGRRHSQRVLQLLVMLLTDRSFEINPHAASLLSAISGKGWWDGFVIAASFMDRLPYITQSDVAPRCALGAHVVRCGVGVSRSRFFTPLICSGVWRDVPVANLKDTFRQTVVSARQAFRMMTFRQDGTISLPPEVARIVVGFLLSLDRV